MADPFAQIPKEALDYFRAKGFKIGFDYRDVWREEHTAAFTVAKAMEFDLLADIRTAVDQALANGETFQQFKKRLTPLLVEKGWWGQQEMMDPETGELKPVQLGSPRRLRVIYDTNLRTARAAGQWQRIQESKKSLPYLLYTVGPSREHRPEHLAWHGTLLPVDDPWWQTHFAPNGWGCKCRIRPVTKYEYEKLLKTGVQAPPSAATQELDPKTGRPTGHSIASKVPVRTTAPPLNLQSWTNKRTGLTEQVPQGIDPGWNYNPGASRLAQLEKILKEKEAAFQAAMKQNTGMKTPVTPTPSAFVAGVLNTPKDKQPPLEVGAIDPATAGKADAVGLSIAGKPVALDHDYTRHVLLHHGSPSERQRGQEPITDVDLTLAGTILNQAQALKPGTPPQSKNGSPRLEVTTGVGNFEYTAIYEVRRARVVLYTMFKRRK